MRKITPKVNVFNGVNNALNPCSPLYRQGAAWDAQNSRLNKSGLWDKAAALSACSLGAAAVRGLPVSSITDHPHYADTNIKSTHIIAKNLKNDSHVAVGPNKYAYAVDDDLGSSRAAHWWDGTDAASSKTIALIWNNTTDNTLVTVRVTGGHGFHTSQIIDTTDCPSEYNTTDKTIIVTSTTEFTYVDVSLEDVYDGYMGGTVAIANPAVAFTSNTAACNYAVAGMAVPTTAISVADNGDTNYGGRMEKGIYYYMYTLYDTAREVESLPSNVTSWTSTSWDYFEAGYHSAVYPTITITADATHTTRLDTTTKVRIYRSFRTSDDEKMFNSPNQFYYVGEIDYNAEAMTFSDYAHDTEIENDPYEGRGSRPPTSVDCLVPFNNRMYYFVDNVVYWSSAGRPEEVALNYTLTYKLDNPNGEGTQTTTVPMQPVLVGGISGEAKYEISELRGETVIGAYSIDNKLWIWTQNTAGFLKRSNQSEGVTYYLAR